MTAEHKEKISESNRGKSRTKEQIENMRLSKLGKKNLPESYKKQSETMKRLGIRPPLLKGPQVHTWKGGITPLYRRIRTSFKYRQWRCDVLTRDNFVCQCCGDDISVDLDVHHIIGLIILIQKYEIIDYDQAMNCEAIWDINNAKTLCKNCHIKEHGRAS